jgi:hypothetical protein
VLGVAQVVSAEQRQRSDRAQPSDNILRLIETPNMGVLGCEIAIRLREGRILLNP